MGMTLVALTGNAAAGVMDSNNGVNAGRATGRRAAKKMCIPIGAQAGMTPAV
jgi:hypothetical protein